MRALLLILALAACAPAIREEPLRPAARPTLPALGASVPAGGTAWSNASLARVFTALTHDLEWGGSRPGLVRYEAPVRVAMTGQGSAAYGEFLDGYLAELRRRARIDIALSGGGAANLHIRFVDGARFAKTFSGISCLVAPGDLSWEAFRSDPDRAGGALETARTLTDTTIFLPRSAAPYQIRSCLIEEVAQALGPANDLYGLGPSIFNDDAAHLWPTALDFLMLRILYRPEMTTGLDRGETLSRAARILEEINPDGRTAPPLRYAGPGALRAWRMTHQKIFATASRGDEARERAERASRLAQRHAPGSAHHCHSLRILGRILAREAPGEALSTLGEAARICARVHGRRGYPPLPHRARAGDRAPPAGELCAGDRGTRPP